jgi:septum formation protein
MMRVPQLILASSSPRRRQLLTEAGYEFQVVAPSDDVECGHCSEAGPAGLVADLAVRKAVAVYAQLESRNEHESVVIVAADTVAECDGFVLGKPHDEEDARRMLRQLRGREHRVLTGVCVYPGPRPGSAEAVEPEVRIAVTRLVMDPLSDAQIDAYLASGEWAGKAGAFGYQDRLGWVHVLEGSESNVVGLPLELLAEMLSDVGVG